MLELGEHRLDCASCNTDRDNVVGRISSCEVFAESHESESHKPKEIPGLPSQEFLLLRASRHEVRDGVQSDC